METREKLKSLTLETTGGVINDCLTFTKLRLQHNSLYKQLNSGGGNFLMALGLLSVLGFLSKIYSVLSNREAVVDEKKHQSLKNLKCQIEQFPDIDKNLFKKFILPRVGSLNEEDAFVNFIVKVQSENVDYLGLDENSARKVWKFYRNKLAHLTVPLAPVGVYDKDLSHMDWVDIEYLISKQGSFLVRDNLILCNSDKLVQNAKKLSIWLSTYIDTCDDENIENALNWLNRELS